MPSLPLTMLPLIGLALLFGFLDGRSNAANVVAPLISTRALSYRRALWLATVAEGAGPFLLGVAVARTIGSDLLAPHAVTLPVVYAALLAAVLWNALMLSLGVPSSASHALAGGLVGAALMAYGTDGILLDGLLKVSAGLFLAPVIGLLAGYGAVRLIFVLAAGASPRINHWFRRGELVSAVALGVAHGSNGAQKVMGLITLGLVTTGALDHFYVPGWVVAISAAAVVLGTLLGGQRTIRTVGQRYYHIRPVHGFSAQAASAVVVLVSALVGSPVSTSHVVSSALLGAGSAQRVQMVRWQTAGNIVVSWLVTIPSAAGFAVLLYLVLRPLIG